jgi:hypothetical protein
MGASVMTGKQNGVAALLRKEHPGIINIHCICYCSIIFKNSFN